MTKHRINDSTTSASASARTSRPPASAHRAERTCDVPRRRPSKAATPATVKAASTQVAASLQPGAPPVAPSVPEAPAAVGKIPLPASPRRVDVTFALVAPHARQVALCGEFNLWSAEATPMRRQNGGRWEATVALAPGRHQYKFVADGQWLHDPEARDYLPNPHGSINSVIEVRA